MALGIQPLPTEVVNLIAAGEVIDSMAAVVRELVENALDAGAKRIVVSLYPDQWRVRVADNGNGMVLTDLRQAAVAHSTSKIRKCEDLWKITSLGFRGEALHSIAQLASLEILSRASSCSEGWSVTYNTQGEAVDVSAVAIAPGTVVTVSNLFGNWAARRQGLPPMSQQMRAVQAIIHQIALCHPHVTWNVQQNGREWFSISPGVTARQILPQLLQQVRLSDLQQLTVKVPTPQAVGVQGNGGVGEKNGDNASIPNSSDQNSYLNSSLYIVLGLPDRCHRRRADWVRVATNRRMVRSPQLEQTILGAFQRTLPRDRYPICFLHLDISPHQIDWNRHPAKAEIYLHHLTYWQEQVAQAIEQVLRINPELLPEALHTERVTQLLKASEAQGGYSVGRSIQELPAKQSTNKVNDIGLIELRAIAQVHNTYILAEHPTGLWLVEQHIAHERVLYEQLCDRWQLIPLKSPVILTQLTPAQLEQLQRLNLDVQPFGEQLWAIRTAPEILAQRDDCQNALWEISLGGDLQTAQVATACRSAIRNGTLLSLPEMQTLLDQWKSTRNPRTCPHGRPIYLSLEESALARFFKRHWVIGKSHGI
ncbi:MAG TPA: DNA mismatch repair endonuclease MutL [Oculatellaceae cyanobacterium]